MTRRIVRSAPLFVCAAMLVGAVFGFAGCTPPVASGDQIQDVIPGQNVTAVANTVRAALVLDVGQPQAGVNNFYFNSLTLAPEGGGNCVTGAPASFHLATALTIAAAQATGINVGNQVCPEATDAAKTARFQSITNANAVVIAPQSTGINPGLDPLDLPPPLGQATPLVPRLLPQPGVLAWVANAANPVRIEQGAAAGVKNNWQVLGNLRLNFSAPARLTGISFPVLQLPNNGQNGNLLRVDVANLPVGTQVTAAAAYNGNLVTVPPPAASTATVFVVPTVTTTAAAPTASLTWAAVAGTPAAVNGINGGVSDVVISILN